MMSTLSKHPISDSVARPTRRAGSGFTLVELLVVIGIIALLISALLPALSAVRGQASMVACSSNLRNLANAAILHANDHQGYLPLAGELVVQPTSSGFDRYMVALNDPSERRYTFTRVPGSGIAVPAVFSAALGKYLGVTDLPMEDWGKLDLAISQTGFQKLFACPSTNSMSETRGVSADGEGQGEMFSLVGTASADGAVGTSSGPHAAAYSDYGFNEGLLGFHYDDKYKTRRLRGNSKALKRGGEVMLFADAAPRTLQAYTQLKSTWLAFTPALEAPGAVSLADAYEENVGVARLGQRPMFDLTRHRGKMNVAFVDGHVDAFDIAKNSTTASEQLRQIYLLPQ